MERVKLITLPQLNDCGGDIKKRWFVYYSVKDPRTGKMKRFKYYKGLNKIKVSKARYAKSVEIINELSGKLKSGWNPFIDDTQVIYADQLRYKNIEEIYGKMRASNTTFRLYSNKYLETRERASEGSLATYRSKLRVFSTWIEANYGEVDVSAVNNKVVLRFFSEFLIGKKKLADKTVRCYKQIISNVFDHVVNEGKMMSNPVYHVPKGCDKDEAPRPVASFDIQKFRDTISKRDPQLWMAIEFETYCFLRPGKELRLLKIRDIDFARGLINVDRFRSKTNRERFATIPDHFLLKIREVYNLHKYNRDYYVFGKGYKPGPECLGKNNLKNRFNSFREMLNMPSEYKLYSWKHTGNSLALDNNISMYALRDQNGHSSVQVTEIYTKNKVGTISREIKDKFPDLDNL